jgi:sucrose-phosphate synthase
MISSSKSRRYTESPPESRGVFVNPALVEPFGLTLLEASASGLPIVATRDGGPEDIVRNCENGILVDPTEPKNIAAAVKTIVADPDKWEAFSKNGVLNVRRHYTWETHAATYADRIEAMMTKVADTDMETAKPTTAIGRRLLPLRSFFITDIDNTLIGADNTGLDELMAFIEAHRDCMGFGVATGRTIDSTLDILKEYAIPTPDIIVSSVGAEIYYGPSNQFGQGWATHIRHKWNREKIVDLLDDFSWLTYQEADTQRPFKISYYMKPGKDRLAAVHNALLAAKCRYNLIYSHGKYLDILPYRASKGKAIRYLSYKWTIPLRQFLVSGDSGNDAEMLRGEPLGVVVGDHSEELAALKGVRRVFFAKAPCAGGILEGIRHYRFSDKIRKECHEPSK